MTLPTINIDAKPELRALSAGFDLDTDSDQESKVQAVFPNPKLPLPPCASIEVDF